MLARDPDRVKSLADFGAEIAVGDLGVPADIGEAMAGVTAVVLVGSAVPAQELNVVASAARAGAGHVVNAASKASADSPIARRLGQRGQAEIEGGGTSGSSPLIVGLEADAMQAAGHPDTHRGQSHSRCRLSRFAPDVNVKL